MEKAIAKLLFLASAGFLSANANAMADNSDPSAYVNPLVGTQSKFSLSTGNTYPAAVPPSSPSQFQAAAP